MATAIALGGFPLHTLGQLVERLEPWQKLSLFHQYLGNHPLRDGLDTDAAIVLVGVCAVMLPGVAASFARRDLAT